MNADTNKNRIVNQNVTIAESTIGDTDAAPCRQWFVAIVKNNTEKSSCERLLTMGYNAFVAKQTVLRVWKNGKKVKVDKIVIPSMVFIKCTEAERRDVVTLPFINRFLVNSAARSINGVTRPLAVIPDAQIEQLRFMLGQSDIPISFVDTPLRPHDKVIITRGSLTGIEGEVIQTIDGKSDVIVKVDILGSAKMSINTNNLEIIKK